MSSRKTIVGIGNPRALQRLGQQLHDLLSNDYQIELFDKEAIDPQQLSKLLESNLDIKIVILSHSSTRKLDKKILREFKYILPNTIYISIGDEYRLTPIVNAKEEPDFNYSLNESYTKENLQRVIRQSLLAYRRNCKVAEQRKRIEAMKQEIKHLNIALDRFVPHQFLKLLKHDSIADLNLGDQVAQEMSILFSDIRAFTELSEVMTPQENFDFVNGYFARMEPLITQNNGFIDKYIGDAIMALFSQSPNAAVQAGIDMLHSIKDYNRHCSSHHKPPIAMGVGVNTGPVILGALGGKSRISTTVISDAVNLASRLENITKRYGVSMAISGYTYSQLEEPDQFSARWIGCVPIKGKSKSVLVYEIFETDNRELKEGKLATQQVFETGCLLHQQGNLTRAAKLFRRCIKEVPGDQTAHTYLRLCQPYQSAFSPTFEYV